MTLLIVITALLLDQYFGEPKSYHPLVGFGRLAQRVEELLNAESDTKPLRLAKGALGMSLLLLPCIMATYLVVNAIEANGFLRWVVNSAILYWAIGNHSLTQHVLAVKSALDANDTPKAQLALSMVVSRDTKNLNNKQIINGAIETTLENGSDAVFAPIFWFLILGAPGVIAYRLVNTLDAMWGYKNQQYLEFGKIAAYTDDVLNYLPARLVAITYAMTGNAHQGFKSWFEQAALLDSPNAGPVMTAGGGSLNVKLGGPTSYHGELLDKPYFGGEKQAELADIDRALSLVNGALIMWCACILTATLVS